MATLEDIIAEAESLNTAAAHARGAPPRLDPRAPLAPKTEEDPRDTAALPTLLDSFQRSQYETPQAYAPPPAYPQAPPVLPHGAAAQPPVIRRETEVSRNLRAQARALLQLAEQMELGVAPASPAQPGVVPHGLPQNHYQGYPPQAPQYPRPAGGGIVSQEGVPGVDFNVPPALRGR